MATISFSKLCRNLEAVAAPDADSSYLGSQDLCSTLKGREVRDRVTIERGADPGMALLTYNSMAGPGSIWIYDSGEAEDGIGEDAPALAIGHYAMILIRSFFGDRALSTEGRETFYSEPHYISAAEYLRCLNQSSAKRCQGARGAYLQTISRRMTLDGQERGRQAEQSRAYDIAKNFTEAQQIWKKADGFLTEARRRDDNDSDLDVLLEIVHRHAAARPVIPPTSMEAATALLRSAQTMLSEFEGSKHLRSFVYDEGDCGYRSGSGHGCNHGSTVYFCNLAPYHFEHESCDAPPEVKEPNGDR